MERSADSNTVEPHPRSCMSRKAMYRLVEMRASDTLCDGTIVLDDTTINVHRAILCSSSEYFRYTFRNYCASHKRARFLD